MALPSGYTELTYIQSSGTQYIDTGFKPTPKTAIELDYQLVSTVDQQRLFSNYSASATDSSELVIEVYTTDGAYKFSYQNSTPNWVATGVSLDTNRHTIKLDGYNKSFSFDNSYSVSLSGYTVTNTAKRNLYLLWTAYTNQANHLKASAKIYSCKIHDNGTLVRDFIPCTNASGAVGLWDDVNRVFYGNAGTGSFISGPVIDPMAPHDGHNTNIGNVAREIDAGTTLIGGVSRDIKSGTVLVSGVLREIEFGFEPSVFTVELKGTFNNSYAYVTINGEKYVSSMTIDVEEGTEIDVRVDYESTSYMSSITLNGDFVSRLNYTLTVTGNVVINSRVGNATSWPYGAIDITME